MNRILGAVTALAVLFAPVAVTAQVVPPPLRPLTMTSVPGKHLEGPVKRGRFGSDTLTYLPALDETIVRGGDGQPLASLYAFSYVALPNNARRPVIFVYNGGPGGAAVFLHLGSVGPRILSRDPAGGAVSLPLVENPLSPLATADLVFLDPADTGFSRSLDPRTAAGLYSIDGDAEAMSQQVIDWLRRHGRLGSPVYLLGESYGTMRAVAMARELARSQPAINVAGLMLAGNSLGFMQKGQMPDVLYAANALPMMASVAWYHGKIDNRTQSWQQAVDKARLFARTEFISALMEGYRLDDATREKIIGELPGLIGIPADYFRRTGKISILEGDFVRELLKSEGLVLDGDDGRITYSAGSEPESGLALYGETMASLAARRFGASGLGTYVPFEPSLSARWNFATARDMALDVTLAKLAKADPKLRIMLIQGRYDTLTVMGNAEYIMRQADLPWDRFTTVYYDGGHFLLAKEEVMSAIRAFTAGTAIPPHRVPAPKAVATSR